MVFDTGHQSYVHKLLTGRQDFAGSVPAADSPATRSGPRARTTSSESSHASSSLSWADGVSRASRDRPQDRHVVAVVGDGALTGGMTWEALNNISDDNNRNLVIVVNDNGRSYAPTIGGMARYLNRVRTADEYRDLPRLRRALPKLARRHARCIAACAAARTASSPASPTTRRCTRTSTSSTSGPVDGHDLPTLIETLELAKYGRR